MERSVRRSAGGAAKVRSLQQLPVPFSVRGRRSGTQRVRRPPERAGGWGSGPTGYTEGAPAAARSSSLGCSQRTPPRAASPQNKGGGRRDPQRKPGEAGLPSGLRARLPAHCGEDRAGGVAGTRAVRVYFGAPWRSRRPLAAQTRACPAGSRFRTAGRRPCLQRGDWGPRGGAGPALSRVSALPMAEVLEPDLGAAEGAEEQAVETPDWKAPEDVVSQVSAFRGRVCSET